MRMLTDLLVLRHDYFSLEVFLITIAVILIMTMAMMTILIIMPARRPKASEATHKLEFKKPFDQRPGVGCAQPKMAPKAVGLIGTSRVGLCSSGLWVCSKKAQDCKIQSLGSRYEPSRSFFLGWSRLPSSMCSLDANHVAMQVLYIHGDVSCTPQEQRSCWIAQKPICLSLSPELPLKLRTTAKVLAWWLLISCWWVPYDHEWEPMSLGAVARP